MTYLWLWQSSHTQYIRHLGAGEIPGRARLVSGPQTTIRLTRIGGKSSVILYNHSCRKVVCAIGCVLLCTLESVIIETTPTSNQRGTLMLAVTVARYRSIVHLLHCLRLTKTGTSTNNRQERQANDARACRLVISHRNVILTAPGMQAQNTGLPQPIAQTTIRRVIMKTITEDFPPKCVRRIVVCGQRLLQGTR